MSLTVTVFVFQPYIALYRGFYFYGLVVVAVAVVVVVVDLVCRLCLCVSSVVPSHIFTIIHYFVVCFFFVISSFFF